MISCEVAPQCRYCACSGACIASRKAATIPGTLTPFAPVAPASAPGSSGSSSAARAMKAALASGMTPWAPCTFASVPSTSIIARISALSEKSRPASPVGKSRA